MAIQTLRRILLATIFAATLAQAQQSIAPVIDAHNPPNTRAQQRKHYVVLVSLDGFRYDYPQKYGATNLLAIGSSGASTPTGMLPSYPSLTFPNHYTLVTGLYPQHHGLVNNSFLDPNRHYDEYVYKISAKNGDGTWYSGTPLWSLAEEQGMRAASFFWPGSEAKIANERPSDYLHFDDKFDDRRRIDQVIAWLKLPKADRPHFITLYYSNTDHAGHDFGPDSTEERAAVHHVDELVGDLKRRLDKLHLPIDLIVTADHGMAHVQGDWIILDTVADLSHFKTDGMLLYAPSDDEAQAAYEQFRAHPDPRYTVYRRADVPPNLHFSENPRIGDPVIVPNGPYVFRAHNDATNKPKPGEHGYDPTRMPEMKAIFFATGPDIRKGVTLPTFPNVDVYGFIANLLQLKPAPNDGTLTPLLPALKHHRGR